MKILDHGAAAPGPGSTRPFLDRDAAPEEPLVSLGVQLEQRVRRALCGAGYPQLSGIGVAVDPRSRHLCLSGRLTSFYLKQLAQEIARQTDGVWLVENGIEVGTIQ